MATLAQIYDWFMTGKKPTQAQFWASWGSFWNKAETIPQSAVSNLAATLNAKTEKSQFDGHLGDVNAHQALFDLKQSLEAKGEANGYVPLNELAKIAATYLNIINDLTTGGTEAVASAETVKTLKSQIDAINVLLASDDLNLDTVQELVNAIKNFESSSGTIFINDLTTGGTTNALTAQMGVSLKALIDALESNKVAKVAGERLINEAEITKLSNQTGNNTGDQDLSNLITLTTDQTVSGIKTFLHGKFGLRNIANTFTSFFANSNTVARTYTLPDKNGTVAMTSDIVAQLSGTVNKLVKFGTATTGVNSRIEDTGTYLGLDTINPPTRDITLGNQKDKVIGIEESESTFEGRNLDIKAGNAINYVLNSDFISTGLFSSAWNGVTQNTSNNDVLIVSQRISSYYKQTGGSGAFVSKESTGVNNRDIDVDSSNGDVFVCNNGGSGIDGFVWKQTGGTGPFATVSFTGGWHSVKVNSVTKDVYALCSTDGGSNKGIYKQTAGTGSFVSLGFTLRDYRYITVDEGNGDLFVTVSNGDIYKQTAGAGSLNSLSFTPRNYRGISVNSITKDLIVTVGGGSLGGDIYKQTGGTGTLNALSQTSRYWEGILINNLTGNIVAAVYGDSLYKQNNFAQGYADLKGGTLRVKAGTGKGNAQSRVRLFTGQKTTSGTDMQTETARMEIDETGAVLLLTDKIYADNTAALAAGERVKTIYWTTTGEMRIVI